MLHVKNCRQPVRKCMHQPMFWEGQASNTSLMERAMHFVHMINYTLGPVSTKCLPSRKGWIRFASLAVCSGRLLHPRHTCRVLHGMCALPRPHPTDCARRSPNSPIKPDENDFVNTGRLSRESVGHVSTVPWKIRKKDS